jgi:hypothetical protein
MTARPAAAPSNPAAGARCRREQGTAQHEWRTGQPHGSDSLLGLIPANYGRDPRIPDRDKISSASVIDKRSAWSRTSLGTQSGNAVTRDR